MVTNPLQQLNKNEQTHSKTEQNRSCKKNNALNWTGHAVVNSVATSSISETLTLWRRLANEWQYKVMTLLNKFPYKNTTRRHCTSAIAISARSVVPPTDRPRAETPETRTDLAPSIATACLCIITHQAVVIGRHLLTVSNELRAQRYADQLYRLINSTSVE